MMNWRALVCRDHQTKLELAGLHPQLFSLELKNKKIGTSCPLSLQKKFGANYFQNRGQEAT
jgi:hypothetical protein